MITLIPSREPNAAQKAQIACKYGMFIHFGINTFNNTEWSDGTLPLDSYAPDAIDADSWVRHAYEAGMNYVILITKHHDGFCLFDTDTTEYCVNNTKNPTDVVAEVAKACEAGGADGISLINTLYGMVIDLKKKKPVLANKMGGYCGTAAFPIALRMVYQVYDAVKIPVVGIGGISTPEHVIQMMFAGASAVEVGAANLTDPYTCPKIIDALPETMDKYGIKSLSEIIGAAHWK